MLPVGENNKIAVFSEKTAIFIYLFISRGAGCYPGGSLLHDEHDRINARGMPMLSADIFLMRQFYIFLIYDRVMIMTSLS